jgi:translation initiation factor 1
MPSPPSDRRVVYSSDAGSVRYCRRCGQPAHEGRCQPHTRASSAAANAPAAQRPSDGIIRISRDKKGRGGKVVTVVAGLPGPDAERDAIAQALKKLCGAGGARKDDVIEIQGDQRARIAEYLSSRGHRVKLAGG